MTQSFDCSIALHEGLAGLLRLREVRGGCLATLPCLYPSGRHAQVFVRYLGGTLRVSDGAQALAEIRNAGIASHRPGTYISPAARRRGLDYDKGEIFIRCSDASALGTLAMLVANASCDAVNAALEGFRLPKHAGIKYAFSSFVRERLPNKFKAEEVAGASKLHKMDYVHRNGKLFIVDPVTADELNVNKAYTAHRDIAEVSSMNVRQWIVYDAADNWKTEMLNLLGRTGAELVTYDEATRELPHLV